MPCPSAQSNVKAQPTELQDLPCISELGYWADKVTVGRTCSLPGHGDTPGAEILE